MKLQKETVHSLVKGSTVFINYLGGFFVRFIIQLVGNVDGVFIVVTAATYALSLLFNKNIRVLLTRFLFPFLSFLPFIFSLISAHDVAQSKQHKSISASDVLKALETIEFSDMVNKLQSELLGVSILITNCPESRS